MGSCHSVVHRRSSVSSSSLWFRSRSLRLVLGVGVALGLAACDDGGGPGGGDGAGDGADDGDGTGEVDAGPGGGDASTTDGDVVLQQVPLIEGLGTLAGFGVPGTQDGSRNTARFNNPVNLVVGPDGALIVTDFDNNLVRRVSQAGDVSTINLPPAAGVFRRPFGLLLLGDFVYVQTDGNSLGQTREAGGAALWRMPLAGGAPELVRDVFGRCRGMAQLPDGRVAMTFYQQHVVELWDPASNTLTQNFAGLLNTPSFAEGSSTAARFNEPYDILVLDDGTLLVADHGNHRLRRIDLDGNVTTFAGTGVAGSDDGPLASATFNGPQGLARDQAGNIYVTDTGSYLVRRISPDGQVTTIAGDGSPGYADDGSPPGGQLYGLEGLDVGADGYLYIADGTRGETLPYHRIRRLTLE